MKTKLLGKRTVVAALLAAVFLVSAAFFAVFAFRGNRVFAEGTYYTDDVSAMPEIDFSETGLVSDAKSETFDNAGVLQEIWGENAPGMTVDTTMTASFMFESGANTGYVVSFRRSGWSEDLKLNFYPDGKVEQLIALGWTGEHNPCPVLEQGGLVYLGSRDGKVARVTAVPPYEVRQEAVGTSAVNRFTPLPDGGVLFTVIDGRIFLFQP